jgi:hypothetical protein
MNPTAIVFWAFLGLVGFMIGGSTGAIIGVTIGLGVSLIASAL